MRLVDGVDGGRAGGDCDIEVEVEVEVEQAQLARAAGAIRPAPRLSQRGVGSYVPISGTVSFVPTVGTTGCVNIVWHDRTIQPKDGDEPQ